MSCHTNVMFVKVILLSCFVSATLQKDFRCLKTADFITRINDTKELYGTWQMAHIKPMYREGFICPAPPLIVTSIKDHELAHWKATCLHKLDISMLDEKKFELKVAFPQEFEERFTIIKRDQYEDRILFPSCKFEQVEFLRDGEYKLWMATREEDASKIPIAISVPMWETRKCIFNDLDDLYYFFC